MTVSRTRHASAASTMARRHRPARLNPMATATKAALLTTLALGMQAGWIVTARAQTTDQSSAEAKRSYRIPAGALERVLTGFASSAGIELAVDAALIQGKSSAGLSGDYTVREGFEELLRGQGVQLVRAPNGAYSLRPAASSSADAGPANAAALPAVTVKAQAEQENASGEVKGYIARRSATGTKTDSAIIETPQSISVVTADFIEAIGATRLKEALAYTPGINTSPWGADSRFDWTILRGFDAQAPGYYLDGLQLRNNNSWAVWQTESYGAERIEVLRGPASVLYGQNGAGGMINVVSKRPTEEPLHELQVQFGDNSRRQIAADFSGPLDEQGKLLYRLTGLVREANLAGSGLPNDRVFLAPALTWRPSNDTSLTVLAHYLKVRDGSSYGSFPEVGTLLPNPNGQFSPKTYVGEPGFDHFNQDQWMAGYLFEHRLNDTWTVRQNARYGYTSVDYRQVYNQSDFAIVNPGNPGDPANFRLLNRFPFGSVENARLLTIDNQVQARFGLGASQHTMLLGLDYQHSRNYQSTYNSGTVAPIDGYAPVYGSSVSTDAPWFDGYTTLTQTGFYLQDQIKWGDWVATLGGRYDRASTKVDSNIDGSTTRITEHKFTKRAGLVYLHPSGWAPYVSYAESFSPTATIDPVTNNPLQPETGRQYEVGLRYQPSGSKDKYSAAIFDLRRQNYITYTTDFLPKQTGEILVRGLELEAAFQPTPRINVVAAYTFTPKAEVTASSTVTDIGKQMQAVSRNQASLWTDYRFPFGLKLGAGARYIGSNHGYAESASIPVPAYTVFDALVEYDLQRWNLALNLRNLTNKTFISNCSAGSCRYGDLRKVFATATYRW
ncbi:TonB-dependent siderophore receptor [Herbaspirillum autotrophicum]|uniref:TonB-dependent siderophore receptor n=1 Tax=Herbaspirillum autotrophicum TaxID=180195 RepID=UPI001E5734FC|nr:TonB-dependent siderophore receptor [Herbaspirillum autotrophicum]